MQVIRSALQVHGKDQPHKTEVMVAMQMTDEYMIDAMVAYIKPHQLHLGSLTTIDHKIPVLNFH
jgi:hypothetical protein